MTDDIKSKKSGTRRKAMASKSDGSTPIPTGPGSSGPTCGHGGCGSDCRVRYVGQTSRITDHHMFHTARAVTNIWAAAIVVGLSVVLTGAIAFSAVQARSDQATMKVQRENGALRSDAARIANRLEMMEKALQDLRSLCLVQPAPDATGVKGKTEKPKAAPTTPETQ
ncbi:MAG: hypothetical protein Q7N87_02785 [Candidatus Uhrbacteria bacterium]|nr:hypothetical protein [Candidatus Uhrbacteria bacterium]MDP3793169.1 hypothetical protein [Candidatus Uhrbacteria bacterium]